MPIITSVPIHNPSDMKRQACANVLLDNSSTASYITWKKAKELKLETKSLDVLTIKLNEQKQERVHTSSLAIKIPEKTETVCTITKSIIPPLPSAPYRAIHRSIKKQVKDAHFEEIKTNEIEIDVLIGLDLLPLIFTEDLTIVNNKIAVHKTKLGYYALGTETEDTTKNLELCLATTQQKVMDLEALEIQENNQLEEVVNRALNTRDFTPKEDEENNL